MRNSYPQHLNQFYIVKCTDNTNKTWTKDLNISPEMDVQKANKHTKSYSTSLVIREMQVKSKTRYYHIPSRWAINLTT